MKPPLQKGSPDDFQTPPEALDPLYPYLKKDWTIWEPACGNGNLVRALQDRGYKTKSSDIRDGRDFLSDHTSFPTANYCIITNPPFSIKQQFLEHCYELGRPFALLLPLTALETAKRQKLFREYGLEMILFPKRINFETPNKVEKSSSWFATAWFTHGLNIGRELTFFE